MRPVIARVRFGLFNLLFDVSHLVWFLPGSAAKHIVAMQQHARECGSAADRPSVLNEEEEEEEAKLGPRMMLGAQKIALSTSKADQPDVDNLVAQPNACEQLYF
ncbi:hypothetical protein HDK77DRAFT_274854 [Phyllosticta capitalensis]